MSPVLADVAVTVRKTPSAAKRGVTEHGRAARGEAEDDGMDPDEIDPRFESEFGDCRTRCPKFYTQDAPDWT